MLPARATRPTDVVASAAGRKPAREGSNPVGEAALVDLVWDYDVHRGIATRPTPAHQSKSGVATVGLIRTPHYKRGYDQMGICEDPESQELPTSYSSDT